MQMTLVQQGQRFLVGTPLRKARRPPKETVCSIDPIGLTQTSSSDTGNY